MAASNNNMSYSKNNGNKRKRKFDATKKFGFKKRKITIENEEIQSIKEKLQAFKSDQVNQFTDFPLSKRTLQGLEKGKFTVPTEIQKECIGLALQGNDILGAAKTGSGKTLAFIVPILERLFTQRWTPMDGLGALIISPTRELVHQTFNTLNIVGKFHQFSGGVVFGAKDKKGKKKDGTKRYLKFREEEMKSIHGMNIVIGTPGRLRELMDLSPDFRTENLQILVLDEADMCLDLGFKNDMDAIIDYLPSERQTMLFSATQTKSVKDLARVNLNNPVYVSVHENAQHSTPSSLQQSYLVCELHDKLNLLWSFIRSHLKKKVLVFFSTCKQVRYVYEAFCKLRPGMTILALHGAMKQSKRTEMYTSFCSKKSAVLIATDIAARGLDFPEVHWVIQMDCPVDLNTYIHRVGRTARYKSDGEALLVLLPSEEEGMTEELAKRKIPAEKIRVNPKESVNIQRKLDTLCAEHVYLKEYAQRAHIMYLKSIFMMSNKKVFDVTKIDSGKFARSLGLAQPPRVRFLEREIKKKTNKTNNSVKSEKSSDTDDSESDSDVIKPKPGELGAYNFNLSSDDEDEEDDDVLVKKEGATNLDLDDKIIEKREKVMSKIAAAKKALKKNIPLNKKITFDTEGEVVKNIHTTAQLVKDDDEEIGGINVAEAKKRLETEDVFDKKLYQEKIKQKHREKRLKLKQERRAEKLGHTQDSDDEAEVTLGSTHEDVEEQRDNDDDFSSRSYDNNDSDDDDDNNDSDDDDDDNSLSSDGPEANPDDNDYDSMEDDDYDDDDDEESNEDGNEKDDKYERKSNDRNKRRNKKEFLQNEEDLDTGLSLYDDQSLALKLLGK